MNVIDAAYMTVREHPGGANALAPRFITRAGNGMHWAILNNKVDPNKDSHHLTLAEADKLMAFTDDYRILHALAANHGFVCVKAAADAAPSDLAILELVAAVWAKSGDVGKAVSDTLADGRVEAHEIERVKEAMYRVQQAMQQMVMRLEEIAE